MIQILVEHYWLHSYQYDVQLDDTVGTLKLNIQNTIGQHTDNQRIQYLGQTPTAFTFEYDLEELEDDKTLGSYGITDHSILYLSDKMTVQLFAKTLTNTTYTLQVSLNEPVLLLKQQIEKKGGLPPYLQRFVFRERHLEDSRSLSDYNIKEDDIVHLIWRLRGGGQDPSYHKAVGYAVVLHPWDGDMRHTSTQGLKLTPKTTVVIAGTVQQNWYEGYQPGCTSEALFMLPANYVHIFDFKDEKFRLAHQNNNIFRAREGPKVKDAPQAPEDIVAALVGPGHPIPDLPDFTYPAATPLFFKADLADEGKSCVWFKIKYPLTAPPDAVTPIAVEVQCQPVAGSHITSVTLNLIFHDNEVTDVEPGEWKGPAIPTDIRIKTNTTNSWTCTGSLTAAWKYLTCAGSYSKSHILEQEIEITASPVNVAEEIRGYRALDGGSCQWSITEVAAPGKNGLVGIYGTADRTTIMSLNLKKKPTVVTYECVIMYKDVDGRPIRTIKTSQSRFWYKLFSR